MTDILYPRPPYLKHKMPNEKEKEDIIIKKGEMLYEELGELDSKSSSPSSSKLRLNSLLLNGSGSRCCSKCSLQ